MFTRYEWVCSKPPKSNIIIKATHSHVFENYGSANIKNPKDAFPQFYPLFFYEWWIKIWHLKLKYYLLLYIYKNEQGL